MRRTRERIRRTRERVRGTVRAARERGWPGASWAARRSTRGDRTAPEADGTPNPAVAGTRTHVSVRESAAEVTVAGLVDRSPPDSADANLYMMCERSRCVIRHFREDGPRKATEIPACIRPVRPPALREGGRGCGPAVLAKRLPGPARVRRAPPAGPSRGRAARASAERRPRDRGCHDRVRFSRINFSLLDSTSAQGILTPFWGVVQPARTPGFGPGNRGSSPRPPVLTPLSS